MQKIHILLPLKTRAQRELAIFATWRVAQSLPAVAASRLEKFELQLPVADRNYAWGQVAMAGALRHRPEAVEWFRRAGNNGLTDRQLAWKARSAMRAGDWADVLASIDAMNERDRQLAPWRSWKARALIAQGRTAEGNALLAPLSYEHNFYGQLASELFRRMRHHLPERMGQLRLIGRSERLRFYRYRPGHRFEPHMDLADKSWRQSAARSHDPRGRRDA